MCRSALPNVISSGWHLHQSLIEKKRNINAFALNDRDVLSTVGRYYLGGLLAHARSGAAFTTPTVNGYKRYRAYSLAPDRATWGRDNRGVMVRVIGQPGDPATHLENRIGEPAANPYLYMASQVYAGLDGIARRLEPGPSADTPYEAQAALLPKNLGEALTALTADDTLRDGFGKSFVDYYVHLKNAELARFKAESGKEQPEPTAWEQREYFDLF
jgi:glutamine synthetase